MSVNDNTTTAGEQDAEDIDINLQDLDDVNVTQVRGARGDSGSPNRETPHLSTSSVGGVLGYFNGLLGQTPIPPRPTPEQSAIVEDHQSIITSPPPVVEGVQSTYGQDQHSGLPRNDGDDAEEFGGILCRGI